MAFLAMFTVNNGKLKLLSYRQNWTKPLLADTSGCGVAEK